ncbi:MAG: class I SAM-dependent methyltransferase [Gemmatimonadetes bacterium]|nr:MAG: class I SAM-dependent methyltransferase [Gemmatimonadota bacterium]
MTPEPAAGERTAQQLREQYEIEKQLADRLRTAPRQERRHLYASAYDELYQRVPHHPQLTQKSCPHETAKAVASQMRFLGRFLNKDTIFLEIGAGDCALSFEVAGFVKSVYAVDVSEEITRNARPPLNFRLILSDGCSIPLPRASVNVCYSNQLMEHLHPDDALEQLENIVKVLVPGGVYICITPNRLTGPHDISRHFDAVATGFHLREYTRTELRDLFKAAGFSRSGVYLAGRGRYLRSPMWPIGWCEGLLSALPTTLRRAIGSRLPFRLVLESRLVGTK